MRDFIYESFLKNVVSGKPYRTTLFLILVAFIGLIAGHANAKNGKIIGKIIDSETGEPLIGVSIYVKATKMGAASDLDGNFLIKNVPTGNYSIVISSIGYNQVSIEDFQIFEGKSASLDIALEPKTILGEKITVKAKSLRFTEAGLLRQRQRSIAISDAISAEAISQAGCGDAAEALTKITGVSVVDGRFVYIRGLGGRYGNVKLNGNTIPSPDPEQQSVPMDMFPTHLLDNIVIEKTFTPDKPGNFSGGSVNLQTKNLPDNLTFSFSTSASYNQNTTFNSDFLTAPCGNKDWLAIDDGMRDIPDAMSGDDMSIPTLTAALNNLDSALVLEDLTNSFSTTMKPIRRSAPLNQSYSFSLGKSYMIGDHPLSLLSSLTYKNSYSFYDGGKVGRWTLSGGSASVLSKDYLLDDSKGTEEVLWGGLVSLNYPIHQNHKFSAQYIYNRQGKHEARYIVGEVPKDGLVDDNWFEHRSIQYTSQAVGNLQLKGEHLLRPLRINWKTSITEASRDEPDHRNFSNDVYQSIDSIDPLTGDTIYEYTCYVSANIYSLPIRFYREIRESNREGQLDFTIPLGRLNGQDLKLSCGTYFLNVERNVYECQFKFKNPATAGQLEGDPDNPGSADPDNYFSIDNVGLIDSTLSGYPPQWHYNIGTIVTKSVDPRNNYRGKQKAFALYNMLKMQMLPKLNLVGGVRFETTKMSISDAMADTSEVNLDLIEEKDWLPSVGLTYNMVENMNFRLTYGRTLARPTIRELSPMWTQDFDKGFIFMGNPDLNRTLIDNYDVRWEWFIGPGEILATSGFYKLFRDPIERTIISNNFQVMYKNVPEATVYGVEFEIRKGLGFISNMIRHFRLGGNLTLTHSEVNIGDYELSVRRAFDSLATTTRNLQGQSPYMINLNVSYNNPSGTSVALLYNVFGPRLSEVSEGGTPDVFEQPRPQLDITFSQKIIRRLNLKFTGTNILDTDVKKTIEYKGQEYIFQKYSKGCNFSVTLSYKI